MEFIGLNLKNFGVVGDGVYDDIDVFEEMFVMVIFGQVMIVLFLGLMNEFYCIICMFEIMMLSFCLIG